MHDALQNKLEVLVSDMILFSLSCQFNLGHSVRGSESDCILGTPYIQEKRMEYDLLERTLAQTTWHTEYV